jgi:WD40 repeat protein
VTPDGGTLITCAVDGQIRFWDLRDGRLLDAISAHASAARSIALSPDGNRLVSGGDDNLVQIWNVETRKRVRLLGMMRTGAETVAWSPDSRWIAAGARYSEFRVWSAEGDEVLHVENDHRHESLAFSPDGDRLYVPTRSHIAVWNLEMRTEETPFSTGDLINVRAISLFRQGKYLAANDRFDKRIAVLDCDSGDLLTYLDGRVDYAQRLLPSPDGTRLASLGPDGMLRLISLDQPELSGNTVDSTTLAHDGRASGVCFAGSKHIVTSGEDGFAKLWRLDQLPHWAMLGPSKDVFNTAYDQTGGAAWTSVPMHEARPIAIDIATGQQRQTPAEGGGFAAANANSVSSDKRWMAIGGSRGEVAVWDLATERIAARLEGLSTEVLQVDFSPSGGLLATGSRSGGIVVWNTDSEWTHGSPSLLHRLPFDDVRCLRFSPDGLQLAATSSERARLCLWDVRSGEKALEIRAPVASTGLAFHPEGTVVAAACDEKRIRLWSTVDGADLMETGVLPSNALAIHFSSDGRTLLSGHEDGSIRLWHLPSSQSLGAIYQSTTAGRCIRSIETSTRPSQILAAATGAKHSLLLSNTGGGDSASDLSEPDVDQP